MSNLVWYYSIVEHIFIGLIKRERIFATDILVSKYLLDDLIKNTIGRRIQWTIHRLGNIL